MDEDIARRLDRLESIEDIRQLAARYAVHVDSRNVDALTDLFVEDVVVPGGSGRAAKKQRFLRTQGLSGIFRTTVHFVGGHSIELDKSDPDRATGVVYCRAEHECGDKWVVAMLQYWDRYERRAGQWLFADRDIKAFYVADVLERPNGDERIKHQLTDTGLITHAQLPEAWPTWQPFWDRIRQALPD